MVLISFYWNSKRFEKQSCLWGKCITNIVYLTSDNKNLHYQVSVMVTVGSKHECIVTFILFLLRDTNASCLLSQAEKVLCFYS